MGMRRRLAKRSLLLRMVEVKEHIEHEEIGEVGVVEDDVGEDLERAAEEKEVVETAGTD